MNEQIEEIEACEACHRLVDISRLIKTPLGYYLCEDPQECIASLSGWNIAPPSGERVDQ